MKTRSTSARRNSRRLRYGLGAAAIAAGGLALTASPASAASKCSSSNGATVCFSTTALGNRDYAVHVGIDVKMSQADAQAIIDAPGEPFSGRVYGSDTFSDDNLFGLPVTWVASWSGGLSAEFDIVVDGSRLNEDDTWGDRGDEVYAKINLFDARWNNTRTFRSATLTGNY